MKIKETIVIGIDEDGNQHDISMYVTDWRDIDRASDAYEEDNLA